MRRDGKGLHKVTNGSEAVWSRGGHHLIYADEDGDIARIRSNGKGHEVLFRQGGACLKLDLSPNGRRLVYEFLPNGHGPFEIRTLDLRKHKIESFETRYGTDVNAADLAWAPAGRRIAFLHWGSGQDNDSVRTVRPDGSHVRKLFDIPPAPPGVSAFNEELAWQTRR